MVNDFLTAWLIEGVSASGHVSDRATRASSRQ
jgi:hypothetical protein